MTANAAAAPAPASLPRRLWGVGRKLGDAGIFFYAAAWLIVLVVFGTLAQRDLGLYMAQQKYFGSWILWVSGIPLPGGQLTMTVITLNLFAKLVFDTRWHVRRAGIIIAHVGSLLLFVGGYVTAYLSHEGSMFIPEGETTSWVEDYNHVELAVIDTSPADHDDVTAFPQPLLKAGATLEDPAFPGKIEIVEFYRNAKPVTRTAPAPPDYHDPATRFLLNEAPLETEYSRNMAGVTIRLTGFGPKADGVYLLVQGMRIPVTFQAGGKTWRLALRRQRTQLPFAIELIDFQRQMHAGTGMAKSYKSVVNLHEGGTSRRVVIQMNEPLRHEGYTFYQSSFVDSGGEQATVLAVVNNVGAAFPYISSIIICIGLLLDLLQRVPALVRRKEGTA